MDNRNEIKNEMSLSDETQFQTDNLGRIPKMSCPTMIGHLSRILKLSCPTLIGHLSRIKKELAEIFGSKLSFCPKITEKGLCPSLRRSVATVAISYGKRLMNIKNHYCMSHMFHEIPTKICDFLGMTFSTLTLASVFQRHSDPQAKNPEKIILDNWILRFASAPLRMTVSVLALLLSLNISTAWAVTECPSGQTCYDGCGDDCLYYYTGEDSSKTLNIIGSGTMTNWSGPASVPWYSELNNITSANISGVSSVGSYAFYGGSLTDVDMPNVTSIGRSAFFEAESLTSVDMPNVTTIGMDAFGWVSSLESVNMPKATKIANRAFWNDAALSYVRLNPDWQENSQGYFLDEQGNRVIMSGDYSNYECTQTFSGKYDSSDGKCYVGMGEKVFQSYGKGQHAVMSSCDNTTGVCTTCTPSQVYQPGTGCTNSCGTGYTANGHGFCQKNPTQVAQNNQQGTGNGTGTASSTGTTTAASCTNGASIGGECLPRRYTPAEISQLVGESNTILLYYK